MKSRKILSFNKKEDFSDEEKLLLNSFTPARAPDHFADRVIKALDREQSDAGDGQKRRISRNVVFALAATLCIATIVGLLLFNNHHEHNAEGEISVDQRETIRLGLRAVAVAEKGSHMAWEIAPDGAAKITQTSGKVFYRVDEGESFDVVTPNGKVQVRGTSFHVEVMAMNSLKRALNGAEPASATVVTVYEGSVAVANDQGETFVGAGQQTVALADEVPGQAIDLAEMSASQGDSPDNLNARPAILLARISKLQAESQRQNQQIEVLNERIDELREHLGKNRNLPSNDLLGEPFYPLTQNQLAELVPDCGVLLDEPPVLGIEAGQVGNRIGELGLQEGEREILNEVIVELHSSLRARMRELYIESTGDEQGADSLSSMAMWAEIHSTGMPNESGDIFQNISMERAGMVRPPEDLSEASPLEKAIRLRSGLGNEFQRLLASELGDDRAHEIRETAGGWPWNRNRFRGCNR